MELSVASGVAGLLSLGITTCNGIIAYYDSWKGADQTITHLFESAEGLLGTLQLLDRVLAEPYTKEDLVQRVKQHVQASEQSLRALATRLAKVRNCVDGNDWRGRSWARIKGSLYPFKESTLVKMKERCNDLRNDLSLALSILQT